MTQEARDEINRKRREKRLQEKMELQEFRRLKEEEAKKQRDLKEKQRQADEAQKALDEEINRRLEEELRESQETTRATAARRKSLSRAFKALPNSPSKFANTIVNVLSSASPTKGKLWKYMVLEMQGRKCALFWPRPYQIRCSR